MSQKRNKKRSRKKHIAREQVERLLEQDPSGKRLARLMIRRGVAAPVERERETFEPLPALG